MTGYVILDFESRSPVDLKKSGAFVYAEHPCTEVICLGYSINGEASQLWLPEKSAIPQELRNAIRLGHIFVAHNAFFEQCIWRKIMVERYGWPSISAEQWFDTMAAAAMRGLPLALEKVAKALRLHNQKDMVGNRVLGRIDAPTKDGGWREVPEEVYRYCRQDVRTELELHTRLGFLPPKEMQVWRLDQLINFRGVRIDLDFVCAAQKILDQSSRPLVKEFADLTGGFGPSQRDKILEWVRQRWIGFPDLRKETITQALDGEFGMLPPEVVRILEIRRTLGSASVKKLKAAAAQIGDDKRIRGLLQYHGAGTGRWAGRLLQPQNFPRPLEKFKKTPPEMIVAAVLRGDVSDPVFQGEPFGAIASVLRGMIVAAPGKKLLVGDFATIEARIVLALAGQNDKLDLIRQGADIYNAMGTQIYGFEVRRKTDHPKEGQVAKHAVLGLGFGMGADKFVFKVKQEAGIDLEIEFAKRIVYTYRKEWAPKVPKLWYGLENASTSAVETGRPAESHGVLYAKEDEWLTAQMPSGRKLWYFRPKLERLPAPWNPDELKFGWSYIANKQGKEQRIHAYGGHLTENVVQALARDIMVHAMFRCERAGLPIIFTVHDEIVAEVEACKADPILLERLMTEPIPWTIRLGIPIGAECWVGERYKK